VYYCAKKAEEESKEIYAYVSYDPKSLYKSTINAEFILFWHELNDIGTKKPAEKAGI
jgi:hypothetical protein